MIDNFPLCEPLPGYLTAMDVAERLSSLPHCVFFDSAQPHERLGRYSFVAADPFDWVELEPESHDPFNTLRVAMTSYSSPPIASLPPFQGGLAGLLSYDVNRSLERIAIPRCDEFRLPIVAAGIYDVVVVFDHLMQQAWIVSQGFPETDRSARETRASRRLAMFRELLANKPTRAARRSSGSQVADLQEFAKQYPTRFAGLTSCFSEQHYLDAVAQAVEYIHAGDVFQINFSQRLLCPATSESIELYRRLRERNPAPFAGYLDLGAHQICSASPERLLSIRAGRVETRPIKGTRARTRRPEADLYAGDELQASEKDRAENIMIVDLLRNDLSRVCTPGSVVVSQLCGLEQYAYVQHLVSVVEGQLREGLTCFDALEAAFPGGSITGAPKVRAMEIIAELEPVARGAYCGSLFYCGFDGTCDSNILIRTVTCSRGWWQLPVGGGIVADSLPRQEYEETWHKAAGMLRALR